MSSVDTAHGTVADTRSLDAGAADVRLRAAFVVSSTGDWVYRLAVPLLVLRITGSAVSTAFTYALEFIPYTVLGLFAGIVADRRDRRRTLIECDVLSTVLAALIAGVAALPHPSVAAIYVMSFALACVRPFYFPAFQGMVVEVVPSGRLSRVNSWVQGVDSSLTMLGPLAGAALVAALGPSPASALNAVSFGVSALLVTGIAHRSARREPTARSGPAGVGADFVAGLKALAAARPVLWGTLLLTATNLAVAVVEGNLFYVVLRVEHLPTIGLGVVLGAQGLGALAGASAAPRLIRRFPTGPLIATGMLVVAAAMALPAALPSWRTLVSGWSVACGAMSVIVVSFVTARQRIVPAEAIGRVASVGRAIGFATVPVGALLGGWALSGTGAARALFAFGAAVQVLVALITVASPLVRIDRDIPVESAP